MVSPRVPEVEAAPPGFDSGGVEQSACRFEVVHDEPEVASAVRRLVPALGEGDELVAHVEERHARDAAAQLELEYAAIPLQRLLEVSDLERDVVDADEPRAIRHAVIVTAGGI